MSAGHGSIDLVARRSGERTVFERIRYDGISRCSRAFPDGRAARVMLAQLGPGVVRGDVTRVTGLVRSGAHAIVTHQTATRLMGCGAARADVRWTLEPGAALELHGTPLLGNPDAVYRASTTIVLAPGAAVLVCDTVAVAARADVRQRLSIRRDGRELWYDALDAGATGVLAVGTALLAGLAPLAADALVARLDTELAPPAGIAVGIGVARHGAFVRVAGDDVWRVAGIVAAAGRLMRDELKAT